MKHKWFPFLAGLMILGSLSEATSPPIGRDRIGGNAIKNFGFALLRALYSEKGTEPIAISPMSITEAVTLAMVGAENNTFAELEALYPYVDHDTMTKAVRLIRIQLKDYAALSKGAFEFASANALWANSSPKYAFDFTPGFRLVASSDYGATLTEEDFSNNATVDHINDWVDKNTQHKIKKLISKLQEDDVAILLNAIYAKGKFYSNFTSLSERDYTDAQGVTTKATYLTQKSTNGFYENGAFKIASLKIGDPGVDMDHEEIALDIIAPQDGKLDTLIKNLDGNTYSNLVSKLTHEEIELSITAGKVEQASPLELVDTLKAKPFSVLDAFDRDKAQFSQMGNARNKNRLFISSILTKTYYEVTPFGFEAAAATAIMMGAGGAADPMPTREINFEGPSLHVVRHVRTGTPLFISVYDSPQLYDQKRVVEMVETAWKSHLLIWATTADGDIKATRTIEGDLAIVLIKGRKVVKVLKKL